MNRIHIKKSYFIIVLLFVFISSISIKKFHGDILSWDTFGYYLYLPATFIYNDTGIRDVQRIQHIADEYELTPTLYQLVKVENGNFIIKYSSGLAMIFSPFFFVAHWIAGLTGAEQDGFSPPYHLAIFISSLLFILLGLAYTRRIISYLFNDRIAIWTLIAIVLGTNLFSIFMYPTSIHVYLFGLYAYFIWITIRWHEDPKAWKAILIGFLCGLITVIRPSEAISILIPLLWGVHNKYTWKRKIIQMKTNPLHIFYVVLFGLIAVFPQLLYWKMYAGQWLFYSYDNPGEGFDFLRPYIIQVLFSFRKGWLVYTPIIIFAILGFVQLYKNHKQIFYPLFIFSVLNFYIVSSWTCWWYAECFGQRALTHSYVILSLPLAAFIQFLLSTKRKLLSYFLFVIMLLLIALNLFQIWQYDKGIIHSSRMTKEYYKAVFVKVKPVDEDTQKLLLVYRSFTAIDEFHNKDAYFLKNTVTIDYKNDESIPQERFVKLDSMSSSQFLTLDSTYIYSPAYSIRYKEMTSADHMFVIVRSRVYPIENPETNPFSLVVTFQHKKGLYKYRTISSESLKETLVLNTWNDIELIYLTPEIRSKKDKLSVYYWHRGQKSVYVDSIQIEFWEPKRGW